MISECEALAFKYKNTNPVLLSAEEQADKLEKLVKDHDVIVRYDGKNY